MATKSHHNTARHRARSTGATYRRTLVLLAARTVATIILMVVAHWLHIPLSGD
jgi:hypothetical protein